MKVTGFRRQVAVVASAVTAAALLLAGCSAKSGSPSFVSSTPGASPSVAQESLPPPTLSITPGKKKNLPVSTEIGIKVTGGEVSSVVLTDAKGKKVAGRMREDGSSWVPDKPLKFGTEYTAEVVAQGAGGQTATEQTSFTTMGRPASTTGAGLYLFEGREYGVAMPVVVEFPRAVPKSARASVQSRLFVTTDPPQPGVWHWSSATQVTYRGPQYWQPGTTIKVRVALGGHPMGGGRYGDQDRSGVGKITDTKIEMKVENKTKQMQVFKNDELLKTIPISLGKKSTPSSSGTMVVMDKQVQTVFDTTNEAGDVDRYRIDIQYAQRLTWGGEFIHAAPWSVGDQGRRNVSHGCVNMSTGNASWLFNLTHIGDPITVRGTERTLTSGNGFTAWNLDWADYIKGSALPVSEELAALGTAAAQPSQTPSAQQSPSPGR